MNQTGDDELPPSVLRRVGRNAGRQLFVPEHFDFADTAGMLAFIAEHPFAQLISTHEDAIRITGAPLLHVAQRSPTEQHFIGHIARRNPQVHDIRQGSAGAAVFLGPDAYISPRWNKVTETLPTWSYVSIQLRGTFEVIPDAAATRDVLIRTITHMERRAAEPWSLDEASPDLVETLLGHIVAFHFHVTDMQGIRRLNQHRKPEDGRGIIEGLRKAGDSGSLRIADLMTDFFASSDRE